MRASRTDSPQTNRTITCDAWVSGAIRFNPAGQMVLDAGVARLLRRQAHVARQHPQPHGPPDGHTGVGQPQCATGEIHPRQVPGRVAFRHMPLQQGAGIVPHHHRAVDGSQYLRRRASAPHATTVKHHQMIGQAGQFVCRVRDIQHRELQLVAHALQPRKDVLAPCLVQCGHGFIQQQEPGFAVASARAMATRWRSPPDRAPGRRSSRCIDPQQPDRGLQGPGRLLRPRAAHAVVQIAPHIEVLEQAGLLEHVAQCIAGVSEERRGPRRPARPRHRHHPRRPGTLQARHAAQHTGLARTGRPEQHRDAAPGQPCRSTCRSKPARGRSRRTCSPVMAGPAPGAGATGPGTTTRQTRTAACHRRADAPARTPWPRHGRRSASTPPASDPGYCRQS